MNDNIDDGGNSKALPDGESTQITGEADTAALGNGAIQETGESAQFSEVFWANANTTTLHQTHPRVPSLKTEMVCQYKFENGRLYVRTLKYKMTTRGDNKYRANIDVALHALEYVRINSPDSMSQDTQWHDYVIYLESPYGPAAQLGGGNRMHIRVDYDGSNNDVEPHEGWGNFVFPAAPPIIEVPRLNTVIGKQFDVSGRNGLVGARVYVRYLLSGMENTIGFSDVGNYGQWQTNVSLPSHVTTFYAVQIAGNEVSVRSNAVTIRFRPPLIKAPANGVLIALKSGMEITLSGEGTHGRIIDIMTPDGAVLHGSTTVKDNDTWEALFNLANYPSGGLVEMMAGHRGMNDWSQLHTFTLLAAPPISLPISASVTDPRGPISGTGFKGAIVEVLRDTQHTFKIGQATVEPDGSWEIKTFDNEMPPGPFSIVARQTFANVTTDVGTARGFKVRPSAMVKPDTTFPTDGSIKFSGTTAHPGATVVITAPGSSVTPPAPVVATGGNWTTTATAWPFGTYSLQIVQKVGDGASGWIESLPFEFTVENRLPDVSELAFTPEYQPTFSGKGNARATVWLWKIDKDEAVAPHVPLTVSGKWSSKASEIWGPTHNRRVRIKQAGDGQETEWVYLDVTIPPLAPGLNDPVEDGLSPKLSGTCWPGAAVKIRYSDEEQVEHDGIVSGGTWQFRRDKEFAPDVSHTVTVTQFAAEQTSPPVSKTFTVKILMLQPLITQPEDGAKVGRVVTIQGKNGMEGATMQLRDVRFDRPLGSPKVLDKDGDWSIDLSALEFRLYTFDAQQTLLGRPSARSDARTFEVVLLPPEFLQPTQNGKLPRMAKLEGRGMANGHVEIFLEGLTEPLLTDVPVNREGHWEAEVTLPVGHKTIWARQTFMDETGKLQESEDTPLLQFDLVPAAPFVESPVENDQVGQQVVVSGFGVPGDTVTVQLNLGTQSTVVLEDRTWSVKVTSGVRSGFHVLQATAMYNNFESDPAQRTLEQSTYRPVIDEPAAGRWLSDPVTLAGKGRAGSVHVVSWFNPDVKWSPPLAVSGDAWRGESEVPLSPGGNWCRVGQTLVDDPAGVEASDWALSARFEIKNSKPT